MNNATYSIYMHINKINGKVYIGQTYLPPEERWKKNGWGYTKYQPAIYAAIQKYGWDNFDHIILEQNLTSEEANEREAYWIKYYQANEYSHGYNLTSGGGNSRPCDRTKEKISTTMKQYIQEHPEALELRRKILEQNRQDKPIICLETGIIYPSLTDAENKTGINMKTLSRCCCHTVYTAYNLHWEFYEPIYDNELVRKKRITELVEAKKKSSSTLKKKVLCVETEEVFESAKEASKKYSICYSSICSACRGTYSKAGGYHWKYIE